MTDETKTDAPGIPSLEDWQHWTLVMGRAQQMLMQAWADGIQKGEVVPPTPAGMGRFSAGIRLWWQPPTGASADPMAMMTAGAQAWATGP